MKLRNILCLVPLLFLNACHTAPTAVTQPVATPKDQYADILLNIVPPENMFAQLSMPYAQTYTKSDKQDKAHSNFMRNVDVSALNGIIRDALVKHFSEAELKALADFYSTPEGRACMAKTAAFASDVVPACAHEANKAFRKTATDAARGLLRP